MMKPRSIALATILCVAFASLAFAATTVKLKSGKSYTGELKKLGNNYRMVMPDGTSQIIPVTEVVEIDGKPVGEAAAPASPTASTKTPNATPANAGAAFKAAKAKADRVDAPIAAVQIWEEFLDKNPAGPDADAAKLEKDNWDKLYKDNAERVKGKWIGGKDLKDLKKKCNDLLKEAISPEDDGVNGVSGLKKLDDIIALYPNHFQANFYKGYYYLVQATRTRVGSQEALAKAMVSLERTAAIAPDAPEVWCNLAIGYNFRREYQKSIESAYRAVKMRDGDEDLISILATAIYYAPPQMRDVNPKVRKINEEAQVLFTRYKISGNVGWRYVRPTKRADDKAPDEAKRPPGVQWSGSGFFVSADGYFLTNHHVATGDSSKPIDPDLSFRVRLEDGSERPAELIAVGDKADVALMKVKTKPGEKLPFLPIAELNPNQGADAMVLGYPATGFEDMTMQISVGKVKSVNLADMYHVWFDLNTTHGNSGGPIVDKHGRVIAILTAGRSSYNMTTVLGVGPDQIEVFLSELGAKIPWKPVYAPAPTVGNDLPLNSEALTMKCRPATLLVLAINGDGKVKTPPSNGEAPKAEETPAQ